MIIKGRHLLKKICIYFWWIYIWNNGFDFWLLTLNLLIENLFFVCICVAFTNYHMEVYTLYRELVCMVVCLHSTPPINSVSSCCLIFPLWPCWLQCSGPVAPVLSYARRSSQQSPSNMGRETKHQRWAGGERGEGPHFVFWGAAGFYLPW